MAMRTLVILILSLVLGCTAAFAGDRWNRIASPSPGLPQAIGSYAAGCLAGAVALPMKGAGYQVMRPSRNRYYGHPDLIAFVQRLGKQAARLDSRLLIGDLSQPRGGPMEYGHNSHQIGLDVDIWFQQGPENRDLSPVETEKLPMISVVRVAEASLAPALWSPLYRDVLKRVAANPQVDRVFINPIIKQSLCRSESNRAWLRKIRPWWGHDAHFHIRLACPSGSTLCKPQEPIPPGDGCDDNLNQWVWELQEDAKSPPKPKPIAARKTFALPEACQAVLRMD